MKIFFMKSNLTIKFAAEELKKYLEKACPEKIEIIPVNELNDKPGIWLYSENKV